MERVFERNPWNKTLLKSARSPDAQSREDWSRFGHLTIDYLRCFVAERREQSFMFFERENHHWDVMTAGERARRLHSRWLTEAMRSGKDMPRIPLRRAAEGGWDELLAKPKGRDVAERWWRRALRWVE